jgi:hypothetical protein
MKDLFSSQPDLPSPINSSGGNKVASGSFELSRPLKRKGRSDLDVISDSKPSDRSGVSRVEKHGPEATNSVDRYFGSFSLESNRHVWDLLDKHPLFGIKGSSRTNRIANNTR